MRSMKKNFVSIVLCTLLISTTLSFFFQIDTTTDTYQTYFTSSNTNALPLSDGQSTSWPMHRFGPDQTASTSPAPASGGIVWYKENIDPDHTTPTVSGFVYSFVTSPSKGIQRFNTDTGAEDASWFISLTSIPTYGTVTIDNDFLYFGDANHNVYCYQISTAVKLWENELDNQLTAPAMIVDNLLYIGDLAGTFYCLEATTGDIEWSYDTEGVLRGSPAIVNDKVYIGSGSKTFYCFDATPDDNNDGIVDELDTDEGLSEMGLDATYDLIWKVSGFSEVILSSPAIAQNKVLFGSGLHLWCYDAITGELVWMSTELEGNVLTSPAVANDEVYIISLYGHVYAFDIDSSSYYLQPKWDQDLGGFDGKSSVVEADGKVFVGLLNAVYCLDATNDGALLWSATTESNVRSSPVIAEGFLFIATQHELYCIGRANQAPVTPTIPSGVATGFVLTSYTFTSSTTDPDGNPIQYRFKWGDGITSTWSTPSADHQWDTAGTYEITVQAKDSYGAASQWSLPHTITISESASEYQLQLSAPDSVTEGSDFIVTVTASDTPIENAFVTFGGQSDYTNSEGMVTFSAPEVETNTDFLITAGKNGYQSVSLEILVIDTAKEKDAWIYGAVYDSSGIALEGVSICIDTSGYSNDCYTTDAAGEFVIGILSGSYIIRVSKTGYEQVNTAVNINSYEAKELAFSLEKKASTPSSQQDALEYLIDDKINTRDIGVKMTITSSSQDVQIYNEKVSIDSLQSKKDSISFQVSAPKGTDGDTIAIRLDSTALSDLSNPQLYYDGEPLTKVGFNDLLNVEDQITEALWTSVLTIDENGKTAVYVLLYTPFSEHSIMISSIVEGIGGVTALIFYMAISGIVLGVFFSPLAFNILRRRRHMK